MVIALTAFAHSSASADDRDGKKEPARQVPVEAIEDIDTSRQPEETLEEPASDVAEPAAKADAATKTPRGATSETANDNQDSKSKPESEAAAKEGKPEPDKSASGATAPGAGRRPLQSGASFSDDALRRKKKSRDADSVASGAVGFPDLPRRKPPKPVIGKAERGKKDGRPNPALKRTGRDTYLCKVLQACRNDFVRCKAKIKHADQSPEWSAEKEACGAVYKDCVHKDFQGGEWFFTRWFYFQELNCK